jgi:UDP-sugar pyrophosphorylase
MDENEVIMTNTLLELGQEHLFANWNESPEFNSRKKSFFQQIKAIHESYLPLQGGIKAYITTAKKLLHNAKCGINPMDGWRPDIPSGVSLQPFTNEYDSFHEIGLNELPFCGFVLVAGGLGERLGYSGIKVALPSETTTNTSYLELYCKQILSVQSKYGNGSTTLPLAIMVSDDTELKTIHFLEQNDYFGLKKEQLTIMKQEKVPALLDNDAHIALDPDDPYVIQTKPHGHGDVHSLMFSTGNIHT